MAVYRIYVEKKTEFNIDGKAVLEDLRTALRIEGVTDVRIINRYDAEEISEENFNRSIPTGFSEPPVHTNAVPWRPPGGKVRQNIHT